MHASCVTQGHLRQGKCHLSLGNAKAASRCFRKVLELEPSNGEAQKEVQTSSVHIVLIQVKPLHNHLRKEEL